MRLRTKLLVVLLPVVVAGLALQWVVSSVSQDRQMTSQRQALLAHLLDNAALRMIDERHRVLATYGLDGVATYVDRYQTAVLQDLGDLGRRTQVTLVVLDEAGTVLLPQELASSEANALAKRGAGAASSFVLELGGAPHLIVARTFAPWGWRIIAAYPLRAVQEAIRRVNLAITASLLLAGLGMGVSLFVGIDRLVIRPIRQLEERFRSLSAGNRGAELRLSGDDEISELAAEMDNMAMGLVAYTAELERSNSELDSFASAVSHDLRAPLRAIDTIAGWLEADAGGLPERAARHLHRLKDQVARMDGMLQDLLRYARASQVTGPLAACDIEQLVAEQLALLAPEKDVELSVEGDLRTLVSPEPPLALVLRNLIDNAIKHHHGELVRLRVDVERRGRRAVFRVADDGPGIPPGAHERVFGLFSNREARPGRTGIGLALVRRIVQRLGGSISIDSDGEGRGTTFVFDWPLDCTMMPTLAGPGLRLPPALAAAA